MSGQPWIVKRTKRLIYNKVGQLPSNICQKGQKMRAPFIPIRWSEAIVWNHRPQLIQYDTVEVAGVTTIAEGVVQQTSNYFLICRAVAWVNGDLWSEVGRMRSGTICPIPFPYNAWSSKKLVRFLGAQRKVQAPWDHQLTVLLDSLLIHGASTERSGGSSRYWLQIGSTRSRSPWLEQRTKAPAWWVAGISPNDPRTGVRLVLSGQDLLAPEIGAQCVGAIFDIEAAKALN